MSESEVDFDQRFTQRLADLLPLVDTNSQPNLNPLGMELRDIRNLMLNVKFFGYELARKLAETLPPRHDLQPTHVGLRCKASTQADMESDWLAYWCGELKTPVVFHRKLWELAYVLQGLQEAGAISEGARGLGFGCGSEPIASYMAAKGVQALVTDLEPDMMESKGWRESGQHATSLNMAFHEHIVSRERFDAAIGHRFVDMNAIPADLRHFDFCWSICALEHLGSIAKGMDFVVEAMKTLRPGGVAIHTTEFNFLDDARTIDNWPTVLFQRANFEALAERLTQEGHKVAPLDFDVGDKPFDRFIDIPPYPHDWSPAMRSFWSGDAQHLKLSIDGFASTCFGLLIEKAR